MILQSAYMTKLGIWTRMGHAPMSRAVLSYDCTQASWGSICAMTAAQLPRSRASRNRNLKLSCKLPAGALLQSTHVHVSKKTYMLQYQTCCVPCRQRSKRGSRQSGGDFCPAAPCPAPMTPAKCRPICLAGALSSQPHQGAQSLNVAAR